MYIQLTTRCNMTCAHCCFSATHKGVDMARYTFMTALERAADLGDFVTLGGGEPTCHKEFFEYLDKAMEFFNRGLFELAPLVITNGKLKGKAKKLLQYVEEERPVYVELSQDEYHDPIDPEILRGFRWHQQLKDQARYSYGRAQGDRGAGIRTVKSIVSVGRAADAGRGIVTNPSLDCCCEDLICDPHGNVFSCGCKTHLLGNIFESLDVFAGFDRDLAHEGGGLPVREHARLPMQLAQAA